MASQVDIGRSFRRFREKLGLTQQQMASLLNLTDGAVGHWESGRTKIAALDVQRIAEAIEFPTGTVALELGLIDADKPLSAYQVLAQLEEQGRELPQQRWARARPDNTVPTPLDNATLETANRADPSPGQHDSIGSSIPALLAAAALSGRHDARLAAGVA